MGALHCFTTHDTYIPSILSAGKDVFWYTKGKGDSGVSQDELEAVKAREREMMAEVRPSVVVTAQRLQQQTASHYVLDI